MLYAFEQKACSLKVLGVYKYGHVPKSRHQIVLLVAQVSIGTKKEKLSVSSSPLNLSFIPSCSGSCISLMEFIPTNCQIKKSNRKEEEKSQSKEKMGRKQEQVYLSFFKRRVRQAVQDKGGGAYRHRKEKETP